MPDEVGDSPAAVAGEAPIQPLLPLQSAHGTEGWRDAALVLRRRGLAAADRRPPEAGVQPVRPLASAYGKEGKEASPPPIFAAVNNSS